MVGIAIAGSFPVRAVRLRYVTIEDIICYSFCSGMLYYCILRNDQERLLCHLIEFNRGNLKYAENLGKSMILKCQENLNV